MIEVAMRDGDIVVSDLGDIALHLADDDNIVQMANAAIYTIKGENIFHTEFGNDAWNRRLKLSDSGYRTVEACAREAILHYSEEIHDVVSITAEKGSANNECNISYTLMTVDGRTISSRTTISIM